MKKYSNVFTYLWLALYCVVPLTHTVWAAVAQNKQRFMALSLSSLPPYQVSGMVHNHGVIGDLMLAGRAQQNALLYSSAQIHRLYFRYGSLVSLGGGYRFVLNPLWMLGGHMHFDIGRLPNQLGYYTKLNPGIEAHMQWLNMGLNLYIPISWGNFHQGVDPSTVYVGNQSRRYIEPNQVGLDCHIGGAVWRKLQGYVGGYGTLQKHNSVIGLMLGGEYTVNPYIMVQLKCHVDTFHGPTVTFGIRAQKPYAQSRLSSQQQQFWRPLFRHVAPLPMESNATSIKGQHHLHFNSTVSTQAMTDAAYEQPCSRLNQSILDALRKKYPPNVKTITLHLYGCFDLTAKNFGEKPNNNASLQLVPYENLIGEYCSFDRLTPLKLQINPKTDLYNRSAKEFSPETLGELKKMVENGHLFLDGLPYVQGLIAPADDTEVRQVAILPTQARGNAVNVTAVGDDHCSQVGGIFVPPRKDKKHTTNVTVQKVVISGLPGVDEPFQYNCGIDISNCDALTLKAIWINNAKEGIYLSSVNGAFLQSLYMGKLHSSADIPHMDGLKHKLGEIIQKEGAAKDKESRHLNEEAQGLYTSVCFLHNDLLKFLRTKTVNVRELFQYVSGIDLARLPNEPITFTDLNIESDVLVGIHAIKSVEVPKSDNTTFGKLKEMVSWPPKNSANKQPVSTASLDISDSLIMTQISPFVLEGLGSSSWQHCVLGSNYLGGILEATHLTLIGEPEKSSGQGVSKDSFVYVDRSVPLPQYVQKAAKEMRLTSDIKGGSGVHLGHLNKGNNDNPLFHCVGAESKIDLIQTNCMMRLPLADWNNIRKKTRLPIPPQAPAAISIRPPGNLMQGVEDMDSGRVNSPPLYTAGRMQSGSLLPGAGEEAQRYPARTQPQLPGDARVVPPRRIVLPVNLNTGSGQSTNPRGALARLETPNVRQRSNSAPETPSPLDAGVDATQGPTRKVLERGRNNKDPASLPPHGHRRRPSRFDAGTKPQQLQLPVKIGERGRSNSDPGTPSPLESQGRTAPPTLSELIEGQSSEVTQGRPPIGPLGKATMSSQGSKTPISGPIPPAVPSAAARRPAVQFTTSASAASGSASHPEAAGQVTESASTNFTLEEMILALERVGNNIDKLDSGMQRAYREHLKNNRQTTLPFM
jgi:hypothetical protein